MNKLIDKFAERILIDYPEKDKIWIDLDQFGKEYIAQQISALQAKIADQQKAIVQYNNVHQEYHAEIQSLKKTNAELIERIYKHGRHLNACYKKQDWSDALDALSLCPEGPDKQQAYAEIETKMNTCTCGLDQLISNNKPN